MIAGGATAEGTARRAARLGGGPGWWRPLGGTGWTASALGFGAYRVTDREDEAAALAAALAGGVNLVDTANNYGLGRSEALVGRVLAERIAAGDLARGEVVVVTKAGYLQGPALDEVRAEVERGRHYAVREVSGDHWHTLDPVLIERLVGMSRRRLGLGTVDVALLHNPEQLLEAGDEAHFYARVRAAFERLELLADAGEIQAYGVSSNTLASADDPRRTHLERFLAAAREVAGDAHRCRVVQLPLNLAEDGGLPVAEACAEAGLAVLTNRPLNALVRGPAGERVLRLADPGDDAAAEDFADARRALGELEAEFRREVGPELRLAPAALPSWSAELPAAMRRLESALAFDVFRRVQADASLVLPLRRVGTGRAECPAADAWLPRYEAAWDRLMRAARAQLARRDRMALSPLMERAAADLPGRLAGASWAQRAVAWAATRPGVSTTLVGMRRPAWVADLAPLHVAGLPVGGEGL